MAKGGLKAAAAQRKAAKRAASVERRQVAVDTELLVTAFQEALMDSVLVVCECGHEFMESSEFNYPVVLPCLLCGSERATTSPRHDETMAAVRARLAGMRITLLGLDHLAESA